MGHFPSWLGSGGVDEDAGVGWPRMAGGEVKKFSSIVGVEEKGVG